MSPPGEQRPGGGFPGVEFLREARLGGHLWRNDAGDVFLFIGLARAVGSSKGEFNQAVYLDLATWQFVWEPYPAVAPGGGLFPVERQETTGGGGES